jgi:UDP-3-O-[3-hydroxymyristoyl] glucosamine N-acyltransferase
MAVTLGKLAEHIGAELHGDADEVVHRVASLPLASTGDVSFLQDRAYRSFLAVTGASAVIVAPGDVQACPCAALVLANPYVGYARAAALLHPPPALIAGVDASARIAGSARIGAGARIEAFVTIGSDAIIEDDVLIGAGSHVGARAVIGAMTRIGNRVGVADDVRIGRRCIVHAGAVIGADGFGYARDAGRWLKIPQTGSVQLGDDVEIGANSTIDRGALSDTVIEDGVKIDNLVQVGHNCRIGAHTAIAGCVGISGSSTIGKRCMIGGGVGIAGHLSIADDVILTGYTMVTKSISEPGSYSSGWSARPSAAWRREAALLRRLAARHRYGRHEG